VEGSRPNGLKAAGSLAVTVPDKGDLKVTRKAKLNWDALLEITSNSAR
jgi:hypothetical protein